MKSINELAADAVRLQDACNGSGVARTLVRTIDDLRANGVQNTSELNANPIVRLILFKLMDLAGCTVDTAEFREAYEYCTTLSGIK